MPLPNNLRSPVNPSAPEPFGHCDRCNFRYHHSELRWQYDWRGNALTNLRRLVCTRTCYDEPQPNGRRPVILPPDPLPIKDPRPGFYYQQEGPPPPVQSVVDLVGDDD